MFKHSLPIIACTCLFMISTASVFADPTSDARTAINGIYQQQVKALLHKNLDGYFNHTTPDYFSVDLKGHKETIGQNRKSIAPVIAAAKSLDVTVNIISFSLQKNLAQTKVKNHLDLTMADPNTGKTIHVIDTNVASDTWIKTKSGWMQKRSQMVSDVGTVDGKPVSSQ